MTIYQKAAQAAAVGCSHTRYSGLTIPAACIPCVEKALAAQGAAAREAVTDVCRTYSLAHGTRFDLTQAAEVSA